MHPSGTAMAAKTGSRFCLSATKLHSFLMAVGFVLVAGEAIMTYKTVPAQRETQEIFHLILHCVALVAGSIGIYAVLKFHYELSILDMNTLHSWIGMSTFCLFGLQFLLCLFSFMFPSANSGVRSRMETWHMFIGIVIFLMAITSAETGLVERFTALGLSNDQPNLIMNFTGLLILLPGVGVALRTRSRMVQVLIGIVISLLAMTSAETVKFTPLTLQRRQEAVIINFIGISILLFGVGVCVVVILRRPS
ncbi:putative transmembrane ascorbate ferrireductase 3 [Apium graveolens]|uniref:putative transmembrane ascorbate ferrireductase 3 n=1 Tax=Apium graveolens TaxID=4045 RepID=UPI003D794BD5